jgi:hypothetical protein
MRKLLFVLPILLLPGCGIFQLHQYDENTVAQITKTQTYETDSFNLINTKLDALPVTDDASKKAITLLKNDVSAMYKSEQARLASWCLLEASKQVK